MAILENKDCQRVALYIPSIDFGGAERQILELAKGIDKVRWDVVILTNYVNPLLESEISNINNTKIILLNKGNKFLYLFRLLLVLRKFKPHIITSYLLSAQTYTLIICPFLLKTKIIFSVRDSTNYSGYYGFKGSFFKFLVEKSSSFVDLYIFNSAAGRRERTILPEHKVRIIPNGIDTGKYTPDRQNRIWARCEAGIGEDVPIVGIIGNFSPYKGYDNFIRAARIVVDRVENAQFVSIGNCDNPLGRNMREFVEQLGLSSSFHFLGLRRDVHKLFPAFDVFCSSSVAVEGFSNVVSESMSCGVPCVVTDVGDSALIVGNTGIVIPPDKPELLAAGIVQLLQLLPEERQRLGEAARSRIVEHFSISRMVTATEKVFEEVLG